MALTSTGATCVIDYGNSSRLRIIGNWSCGFWIRPTASTAGTDYVLCYGAGTPDTEAYNLAYVVSMAGSSGLWDLAYRHEYGAGSGETTTFNADMANDTWYYCAWTRDVTANTVKLWTAVEGGTLSLISTFDYTNDPTGSTDSSCKFLLFDAPHLDRGLENTGLAHVSIHNRALTVQEHQQQMSGWIVWSDIVMLAPLWSNSATQENIAGPETGALTALTTLSPPGGVTSPFFDAVTFPLGGGEAPAAFVGAPDPCVVPITYEL